MSAKQFTCFPGCIGAFRIALVIISISGVPFLVSRYFPQGTSADGSSIRPSNQSQLTAGRRDEKLTAPWLISSRERIDHSVHGSFCPLDNAVPDILGCLRSILRHVGCRVNRPRRNGANRDGNGENDRKECFHGTKVSLPPARVRLPDFTAIHISNEN